MQREAVAEILRDRGREPWEVSVLLAFLEELGVLRSLPESADHEDIDEAARLVFQYGKMSPDQLSALVLTARETRLHRQQSRLDTLVDSLNSIESAYERSELEHRARRLAETESQLARVGIPSDLVVPVAGLLQVADSSISESDSPDHVRRTIHLAAKRLLEIMADS